MERVRGVAVRGVVKAVGVAVDAPVRGRVDGRSEPRRGQEEDVWGNGDTLQRGALKRADSAVCGRVISCSRGLLEQRLRI
jgi:hypothetical protein